MKSLEELQAARDKAQAALGTREEDGGKVRVMVGMATCGIAAGADTVFSALTEETAKEKLTGVSVKRTGCVGICQYEPVVEVYGQDGTRTTYIRMTPEKALKLVHQHLIGGEPVVEYTIGAAGAKEGKN